MYIYFIAFIIMYMSYYNKYVLAYKTLRNMRLRVLLSNVYKKNKKMLMNRIKESYLLQSYNLLQVRYAELFYNYYDLSNDQRLLIENCKDLIL